MSPIYLFLFLAAITPQEVIFFIIYLFILPRPDIWHPQVDVAYIWEFTSGSKATDLHLGLF